MTAGESDTLAEEQTAKERSKSTTVQMNSDIDQCHDLHDACRLMAENGACEGRSGFDVDWALSHCPKSCGKCQAQLEVINLATQGVKEPVSQTAEVDSKPEL